MTDCALADGIFLFCGLWTLVGGISSLADSLDIVTAAGIDPGR